MKCVVKNVYILYELSTHKRSFPRNGKQNKMYTHMKEVPEQTRDTN